MVAHPVSVGLDQSWPLAAPGVGQGLPGRGIDGQDVVPVHLNAGESVGDGLLGDGRRGRLPRPRHGDGELVVQAEEDGGRFENTGEVQPFVEVPFRCRPVAERRHDGDREFPVFRGHPRPHGLGDLRADWDGDGIDVQTVRRPQAGLVPHPEMVVIGQGIAQSDIHAEVAEVGEEPVVPAHGRSQPDLAGFVAAAGWIGAEAALPLELEGLGVGGPGPDHAFVDRPELGVGKTRIEAGRGFARFVEDPEPFPLERIEGFDHRSPSPMRGRLSGPSAFS